MRGGAVQKGIELFDLSGKRALITGSSQGIGFSLAQALAAAGAEIVLNGRDAEKLATAAGLLSAAGTPAQTLLFDTTDARAVRAAIDAFEQSTGPIDILVNNAGMQHRAPLEEFEPDMFELLMRTNVSGAFNVGQAVARHMIARGRGKIINIASIQTALARPGIAPYTASKGALGNLTKGMATDWARHGLAVNAIAPGYLIRRSTQRSWPIPSFRAGSGGARRPAAGADWEELTGACIFLASDASSYVNGHILYVDGGMSACL
ncbi:SDR family NAD(P)-dependent oxidoreductase [Rhizobium sp. YAF28]|uniref:SDR family NAD(P)-dependent oxidoreductase n=1 Tax=Rhizobium sp. YAF28 TaxID=3233081 RepID=UPI003F98D41A